MCNRKKEYFVKDEKNLKLLRVLNRDRVEGVSSFKSLDLRVMGVVLIQQRRTTCLELLLGRENENYETGGLVL